jgi:phosphate starvation-inducible PhoH-like protein
VSKKSRHSRDDQQQQDRRVAPRTTARVVVSGMTHGQKEYIKAIMNNRIIFCAGPAGTGKTAVAVGMALQSVLSPGSQYKRIIVMRPVIEACGEHLGFIPGDLESKMTPWIKPVMDNMMPFLPPSEVQGLFKAGMVEVIPLAFARGRSLNDAFIVLDEAQNCSEKQMKMALTRMGNHSKMIVEGDTSQRDSDGVCGLMDAMSRLEGINGVGMVMLGKEDIVRDPMIGQILDRYDDLR